MNVKLMFCKAFCLAALFVVSSCGDTNPGPTVAVFKTATVSVSLVRSAGEVVLFPGTSCPAITLSSTQSPETVTANATLTSAPFPTSSSTATPVAPQPISFYQYDISYTPINGGPPLPASLGNGLSAITPAGGGPASLIPTIQLTDARIISTLQSDPILSQCPRNSYSYRVNVVFYGTELGGTNATVTAFTNLTFTNVP